MPRMEPKEFSTARRLRTPLLQTRKTKATENFDAVGKAFCSCKWDCVWSWCRFSLQPIDGFKSFFQNGMRFKGRENKSMRFDRHQCLIDSAGSSPLFRISTQSTRSTHRIRLGTRLPTVYTLYTVPSIYRYISTYQVHCIYQVYTVYMYVYTSIYPVTYFMIARRFWIIF